MLFTNILSAVLILSNMLVAPAINSNTNKMLDENKVIEKNVGNMNQDQGVSLVGSHLTYCKVFDISSPNDITIDLEARPRAVKNGASALTKADYSVSGNKVTINKKYLASIFADPNVQTIRLAFDLGSGGDDEAVIINRYNAFTSENWSKEINNRYLMIEDLLKKYDLHKMSRADVIKLLGNSGIVEQDNEKISYFVGNGPFVFNIFFDKYGKVSQFSKNIDNSIQMDQFMH